MNDEYDSIRAAFTDLASEWWANKDRVERTDVGYKAISAIVWIAIAGAAIYPPISELSTYNAAPIGWILLRLTIVLIVGATLIQWEFPAHFIAAYRGETVPVEDALAVAATDLKMTYRNILRYWPAVVGAISFTVIVGMSSLYVQFEQSNSSLSYAQMEQLVASMSVLVVIIAMIQIALLAYVLNPGRWAMDEIIELTKESG